MTTGLTDTHAHLDYLPSESLREVLDRARAGGVDKIITVGTSLESSRRAVAIAHAEPGVYAAVGIHPHEADSVGDAEWQALADLAVSDRVVAIGETGLDYHYQHSSKESQSVAFERQLDLADALELPVIIHNREAFEDVMATLDRRRPDRVVLHCFSGAPSEADAFLALGCYISFSGIVTFAGAETVRKAATQVPLDRLLVETDCPYLTPHPFRGEKNEPAHVALVAEQLAETKGIQLAQVVEVTSINAATLFGL